MRLEPADSKSYRRHGFTVPPGTRALRFAFAYDRGGELPHNLLTLSVFDPGGFRGAGHRFAPRQEVRLAEGQATPGFLAGPLPGGEWTVEIDAHCIIAPALCEIAVEATEPAAASPAPVRPPRGGVTRPARGRRWLRGELHLHSTHSDGRWTTAEMAQAALGRGLDFMFLTDHNTVTGVGSLRDALAEGIAVHAGQELTTFRGHALALGPGDWIDWRTGLDGRSINDVARDVRALGGVFVIAHPDAAPDPFCTGCRWTHDDFDPALAHAVEVWGGRWNGPDERNEGCLALFRRWLDAGHRVAATGATDAHRHEDWQGAVPLTYVLAEDTSSESLLGALREGRTYVSSGPRLSLEATWPGGTAGIGATAKGARVVAASCAGSPGAELRLVSGERTRARSWIEGEGRLAAAVQDGDRWFCAEVWQDEILLAVTSPVYLER